MRKVLTVVIADEGRDRGKVFVITEMSAVQTEKWAMRAIMAIAKSGVEIPDGIQEAGVAGIATLGLRAMAGMDWKDAEPLMDEMMSCVKLQPDANHPEITRSLILDDIEELATRLKLRAEVFTLHTGFSWGGGPSTLTRSDPAPTAATRPTHATPTSRQPSVRPSVAARPV